MAPSQVDGPVRAVHPPAAARIGIWACSRDIRLCGASPRWRCSFSRGKLPAACRSATRFRHFPRHFAALVAMLLDGSLFAAYFETLQPLIIGIVISGVIGIVLGIVMGLSRSAEWLVAPLFIVVQAAPMAALIPLITFVYGIGLLAKTLAVIMLALPVIVLNGYKAVRNANPSLVAMCRSFQGTKLQQIAKVIIPDASPVIFAGLAAGFGGRLHRRHSRRASHHADGYRRPHHLSSLGCQLRRNVRRRRVDHTCLNPDARSARGFRGACSASREKEGLT